MLADLCSKITSFDTLSATDPWPWNTPKHEPKRTQVTRTYNLSDGTRTSRTYTQARRPRPSVRYKGQVMPPHKAIWIEINGPYNPDEFRLMSKEKPADYHNVNPHFWHLVPVVDGHLYTLTDKDYAELPLTPAEQAELNRLTGKGPSPDTLELADMLDAKRVKSLEEALSLPGLLEDYSEDEVKAAWAVLHP